MLAITGTSTTSGGAPSRSSRGGAGETILTCPPCRYLMEADPDVTGAKDALQDARARWDVGRGRSNGSLRGSAGYGVRGQRKSDEDPGVLVLSFQSVIGISVGTFLLSCGTADGG